MWERVRSWLFPVVCLGCGTAGVALCGICGPAAGDRIQDAVAGTSLTAAGSYRGLLRRAIVAMKRGERDYLDPFAALLAEMTVPGIPLVPLPTTRGRSAARGFDQGIELAARTARLAQTSWADVLEKRGIAQRGLGRRARLASGGRFRVRRAVVLPEVAIVVDDVCTTGATLTDGIAALRGAGVAIIGAIVVARTPPGGTWPTIVQGADHNASRLERDRHRRK